MVPKKFRSRLKKISYFCDFTRYFVIFPSFTNWLQTYWKITKVCKKILIRFQKLFDPIRVRRLYLHNRRGLNSRSPYVYFSSHIIWCTIVCRKIFQGKLKVRVTKFKLHNCLDSLFTIKEPGPRVQGFVVLKVSYL